MTDFTAKPPLSASPTPPPKGGGEGVAHVMPSLPLGSGGKEVTPDTSSLPLGSGGEDVTPDTSSLPPFGGSGFERSEKTDRGFIGTVIGLYKKPLSVLRGGGGCELSFI